MLAANIDTVLVVHPIGEPPNLRRIERELSVAWDSGAVPVVVLTKADLSADPEAARAAVESVALGADVIVTNALAGDGIQPILGTSRTIARRFWSALRAQESPRSSTRSSASSDKRRARCV